MNYTQYLEEVRKYSPDIIGKSEEERPIYRFHKGLDYWRPIMILSGVHGNEKDSVEELFLFVRNGMQKYAGRHSIYFYPVINPDGYITNSRKNAGKNDINRGNPENSSKEARLVRGEVSTTMLTESSWKAAE